MSEALMYAIAPTPLLLEHRRILGCLAAIKAHFHAVTAVGGGGDTPDEVVDAVMQCADRR